MQEACTYIYTAKASYGQMADGSRKLAYNKILPKYAASITAMVNSANLAGMLRLTID